MALRTASVLAGIAVLTALAHSPARAEVAPGKPAPDFTATDINGKPVTLSSFKGKTVVIEWTNEGCPYVQKHYGGNNMQTIQKAATAKGVV